MYYFYPFGSVGEENLMKEFGTYKKSNGIDSFNTPLSLFYDQEPLLDFHFNKLKEHFLLRTKYCKLLANSEHSDVKKKICKINSYVDWYYFFHGFAALDWYRDYKYFSNFEPKIDKVFISLNRLSMRDRSYRLLLVSEFMERNLLDHGFVSLSLNDRGDGTWEDEINDPHTKIPNHKIPIIQKNLSTLTGSLVVDKDDPQGELSAHAGPNELTLNKRALWHVVSETVFYYDKLHLTEKIFKPITAKRPFILVAAPGNLAYLKSYGFKTFDKWIDESYDNEIDPAKRIEMIANELEKLCKLTPAQLQSMHSEMQETLEYNFNHFYGKFKEIIIDELLDNFKGAIHQWNHARVNGRDISLDNINFAEVRRLLLQ